MADNSAGAVKVGKLPPQIKYIVGNEACERFSFYGMRSILVVFMTRYLLMADNKSEEIFHLFVAANYALTLIGAFLSDRFLGRYRVIFWLSLVYCAGHFALAMNDSEAGLYLGLSLIALGAGGIKPCVAAFVGDQFGPGSNHMLNRVFELFYWSINVGGFFSALFIPEILPHFGPRWAFGIPGILMAIATLVFWLGRKDYHRTPPTKQTGGEGSQFGAIVFYALRNFGRRPAAGSWLDVANEKFSAEKVEGAKAAVAIFKVFITVAAFWALWDQQGSSWVLQAQKMNLNVLGMHVEGAQIQALNPILILVLIPVFSFWLYPGADKLGLKMTPLRKMSVGMLLAALSFVIVGVLQLFIDAGHSVSVAWQVIPAIVVAVAEIMVSITGLEFAYTQAPPSMKSTIMSFWLLTVAGGDLFDAVIFYLDRFHGAAEFFFYAIMMFLVALVFMWLASGYRGKNYAAEADADCAAQPA